MKWWLEQFDEARVRTQAIIVVSIALILGGSLAAVILATDEDYTRDEAAADANAFCGSVGVEHFDYTYNGDGKSQVICKDGALRVFP